MIVVTVNATATKKEIPLNRQDLVLEAVIFFYFSFWFGIGKQP